MEDSNHTYLLCLQLTLNFISVRVVNGQEWRNRINNDLEVRKEEIGDKNQIWKSSMMNELRIIFDKCNQWFFLRLSITALCNLIFKSINKQLKWWHSLGKMQYTWIWFSGRIWKKSYALSSRRSSWFQGHSNYQLHEESSSSLFNGSWQHIHIAPGGKIKSNDGEEEQETLMLIQEAALFNNHCHQATECTLH